MKKKIALSLSLIILVGVSGCTSQSEWVEPGVQQTSTEKQDPSTPKEESDGSVNSSVEDRAMKTLSEFYTLMGSEQADKFSADQDTVRASANKEAVQKMEANYERHSDFLNQLQQKISIPSNGDSLIAANGKQWGFSDKAIEKLEYLTAAAQISQIGSENAEKGTPAIFPGALIEENGETSVLARNVYLKDENGAIKDTLSLPYTKFAIKDGGKSLALAQSGEYSKSVAKSILESDVKNAATVIETYIIRSGATVRPIQVEQNRIIDNSKYSDEYVFKTSPKVSIAVEGNTNAYKIIGTIEGHSGKVVYDNQKGGLQNTDFLGYEAAGPYDANLFNNYNRTVGQFEDIRKAVDKLNSVYSGTGTTYEIVEKNGEEYVKVIDPKSTLAKNGELLYVFNPDRY